MRLQPDIIKLDRALVDRRRARPGQGPLISSFVRYARDIDATVCAEGVETLEELDRLADLDVASARATASRARAAVGTGRPPAPRNVASTR